MDKLASKRVLIEKFAALLTKQEVADYAQNKHQVYDKAAWYGKNSTSAATRMRGLLQELGKRGLLAPGIGPTGDPTIGDKYLTPEGRRLMHNYYGSILRDPMHHFKDPSITLRRKLGN